MTEVSNKSDQCCFPEEVKGFHTLKRDSLGGKIVSKGHGKSYAL